MSSTFWYEISFLKSLGLTILVESIVLAIILKVLYPARQVFTFKPFFICLSASALTLPYLWFIGPVIYGHALSGIIIAEFLIILTESLFYFYFLELSGKRAVIISLLCNTSSMVAGILLNTDQ